MFSLKSCFAGFCQSTLVLLTCCFTQHMAVSGAIAAEPPTTTASAVAASSPSADVVRVPFQIELQTVLKHDDNNFHWFHPRATVLTTTEPDKQPAALLTVLKHLGTSDHYSGTYVMHSTDLGKTWTEPLMPAELDWVHEANGIDIAVADVTPIWHARSGKVIAVGAQVRYSAQGHQLEDQPRAHQTAYAVFDPATKQWTPWRRLEMPAEERFNFARSACAQMVIEPAGTLLLPFYISESAQSLYRTAVVRCSFDGQELKFKEAGDELKLDVPRGLYEPSLINHNGRFFLTLRNDKRGYVTKGLDGLHFEPFKAWTFDDGEELGSYNTQQHWLDHGDALYLCYTRRGANNDHVFRHRAPLFIAQVDPQRLMVLRDTEKILLPERGATFGNFGATKVNETEAWVTDAEGIFRANDRQRGAEGLVYLARVKWDKPSSSTLAPATSQRLVAGRETKVVCFGDSVTGVYYHTGSRRAYPEILQIALQKIYQNPAVSVVNAGISGNTTRNALARIDDDVLAHRPHLVTVMFGLNDMTRISPEEYQENLRHIIDKCQAAGAEVVLCTPNNVIENAARPSKKLEEYCQLMHDVGRAKQVPVADVYSAFRQMKQISPANWRLLMSDEIHPNMAGHKRMAEVLSAGISGSTISMAEFPTLRPRIKELLAKAKAGKPIKVLACEPGNTILADWLRAQVPDGTFDVIAWEEPPDGTLAAWTADAKARVRALKPDFVLLCPPRPAKSDDVESIIYHYSWLMNWSLNFGAPSWDCVVVHPQVFGVETTNIELGPTASDALLQELVPAQDLMLIDRAKDDVRSPDELIQAWLDEQLMD